MAAWTAGLLLVSPKLLMNFPIIPYSIHVGVQVNINPNSEALELSFCLQNVGVRCLVIAQDLEARSFYRVVLEAIPEILTSEPGRIQSLAFPRFRFLIAMGHKSPA